jgi:hypothetical protein
LLRDSFAFARSRSRMSACDRTTKNMTIEKCPFHGHFLHIEKFAKMSPQPQEVCSRRRKIAAMIAAQCRADASSSLTLR